MITTYRQRNGWDAWHKFVNCSLWPVKGGTFKQVHSVKKPAGRGEICNQCKSKERRGVGKRYPDPALTG